MSSSSFVHLHNHTDFSLLDGASRIPDLTRAVADQGMPAAAITDHGYMFGAYKFWQAAEADDIKPIIGLEGYLTPGTHRTDLTRSQWGTPAQQAAGDDVSARGSYTHLTMWAESTTGMHNLFRIASLASLEGQMGKWPRADRELLQTYAPGIIATTGCPSGEVQTRLRLGQYREAVQAAADFRDIFGPENYFVELMDHGLSIEKRTRNDLLRLARDLNLPLVATNDLHYVHEGDAHAQEAMLCINSGSLLSEPTKANGGKRFAFDGTGYYLKSAEQMRELFRDLPEACDNTLAIAERCNATFDAAPGKHMPHFPVPAGETEESYFVAQVHAGLRSRFRGAPVPQGHLDQAAFEISVITEKGFPGYYLVVADFIRWAKEQGIRVGPGRGSGSGSTCAWALGITELDPAVHGLLFERFLNPQRQSIPDFDIDFDDRRREEVVQYVSRKYGPEYVLSIVTYGTYKPKNSTKDAARVLGYPYALGDKITKAMPATLQGKDVPLSELFTRDHKRYQEGETFRRLHDSDPDVARVYDLAKSIEGITRQWGVHAAGVIMSSTPTMDVIPIHRRSQDGALISQFDYPACEALGMVKMDFLGLRNLTVLSDAVENIERAGKGDLVLEDLPLDDQETYELLQRGDTAGVFQFDSSGYQELCRQMRPDQFSDITALGALYRPGPMGMGSHTKYALRKNKIERVIPIHHELEKPLAEVLRETYGLIVYQEQVMQIAQEVAGYTLGEADLLRRAMGKKKKSELDAQYAKFEAGMRERSYSQDAIQTLWRTLLPFADYAFNKSHSAAYGMISYWTAYLKVHYPAEYMAAILTSVGDSRDALAFHLNTCRRMHLSVLPPDINESRAEFTPADSAIRFGLVAISGVGATLAAMILKVRGERDAPFASFEEFVRALPESTLTKVSAEALIKAGAFDSLGHSRRGLMMIYEGIVSDANAVAKREAFGEMSLFDDGFQPAVEVPEGEWPKDDLLAFERQMLGLYVSDHPLSGMEELLEGYRDAEIAELTQAGAAPAGPAAGAPRKRKQPTVTLCGLAVSAERKVSKKGDAWAKVVLEDFTGQMECLVFPKTYAKVQQFVERDSILIVNGTMSYDDGKTELYVDDIVPMPRA